uniref:ABM domain-containing protein n=1 Tax=Globisporangium ultimum (strain ATCC 200006 / CBS 805.95 / DAOM BR144) TaxID=431595 RepID=K3WUZ9_GLOUD
MHPVGECSWLGLTVNCLPAIDLESPWNYLLAHWLLAGVLFTIGCVNALAINFKGNYLMTASTTGYVWITAAFAIFRAQYGIGKPLLIGAAMHNWFEWVFVACITRATFASKKAMITKTSMWITFIILLVAIIPDTKIAVLVEQSVGIMLDFFLVMSYFEQAVLGQDAEVRSFYLTPFISAAVHLFFTILPLVFANFVVGASTTFVVLNEFMIYISPVITHGIYYVWGQEFDRRCNNKGDMEQRFMVKGATFKMAAAFGMGLIPLVGIGLHSGSCQAPTVLTGTTVARVHPGLGNAFIDRITQFKLVETAKKTPGCVDYVLTQNIRNTDEFRFIEKWETIEAVTAWVEKGLPSQLFHNDAIMTQLLVGGKLQVQGAYTDVAKPKEILNGGVAFTMGSPCSKVWGVVGDWNNCSWVVGCKHAHMVNTTTRTLHFANNRQLVETLDELYNEDMTFTSTVPGLSGSVMLYSNATSGGCDAMYSFRTDGKTHKVNDVYRDFMNNRIPKLQSMFSV